MNAKHIVVIGFKNVGKTVVGKLLAQELEIPFIDLDEEVEKFYQVEKSHSRSCREIMKVEGEKYFRLIEQKVLKNILEEKETSVIALGGGTPLLKSNQLILKKQTILHVTAPKSVVIERILQNGQPAFFSEGKSMSESFEILWAKREPVFQKLANFTFNNVGNVNKTMKNFKNELCCTSKRFLNLLLDQAHENIAFTSRPKSESARKA